MMNNTRANQSLSAFEEKAAPKRGALREFAAFYKPHLGMFLLDMFCALVIALVDILFPVVTRKVLYDYIPNQAMRTFLIVMGAMLAAFLIRTAAQWIVTYLGHLMGVHIEADMRTAIFAHMQKLGFSFYDKNRTGLLMSRVTTDLFDITELAHHGPEDLFISIVTLTGSFLVLWNIQKKLALVLMIAVPMIVLFVAMRRRNMMKVSRDVKRRTAGINAEIESSISGVRVAKAFGNEDEEIDKFTRCTDQYVSAKQGYYKVMAGFFSGTELMMNLMSLSVIFVGSYLIMKNQMDIATLVTFNMYVASVQSPIRKLTQFTEQFTQGMAGFQRFRAIMHEDPDIVDAPDAVALTHVAVDGAVEQVAQRPGAFVEHGRHADPREIADKAARDADKAAPPRAEQRFFRDARAVNHQRADDSGDQRRDGRALNAQRGEAAQAENQQRVQRDVDRDGDQRTDKRNHNAAGALQQRAAAARERQKRIADGDDAQIGRTQRDDLLIRGEQADDALRKEQRREHEQQGGRLRADGHQAVGAAHARIVARAVKLGDEHGRAAGKAEKDDG